MAMQELPLIPLPKYKREKRYAAKWNLKSFHIGGMDTETKDGFAKLVSYEFLDFDNKSNAGTFDMNSFFDFVTGVLSLGYEPKYGKNKGRRWMFPHFFFYNLKYDHDAILKHLPDDLIKMIHQDELIFDAKTEKVVDSSDKESGYAVKVRLLTKKHFSIQLTGEKWKDLEFVSVRTGKTRKIGQKQVSSIKFWDIAQWYRESLKDNAIKHLDSSFNKIDIDPIDLGYKEGWNSNQFWTNHLEEIKEYAIMDARITGKLARRVRNNLETINARFNNPYSVAKIAEQFLLDQGYQETIAPLLKGDKGKRFLEFANTAYHGGWFETSGYGYLDNVISYDIKSAYPAVMYNLPSIASKGKINGIIYEGTGKKDWEDWLSWRKPNDIGFVRAHFEFPRKQEWYPLCDDSKAIGGLCSPSSLDKIMTVYEYEEALKWNPIGVYVGEWMYFYPITNDRPFADTIQKLFTLKESNPEGSAEYEVSKILINSLYGKTIQGRKEDYEYIGNIYQPCFAAMITGKCRAMIAEANRHSGGRMVMCATDGAYFKDLPDGWRPPKKSLTAPGNLGEWEFEAKGSILIKESGCATIGDFTNNKLKTTNRGDNAFSALHLESSQPDWLTFCKENASVAEVSGKSRERPISAKLAHARGKPEQTNIFISQDWKITCLPSSKKRLKTENVPENFGDLSQNWYELQTLPIAP
jgi:hypothetical protein